MKEIKSINQRRMQKALHMSFLTTVMQLLEHEDVIREQAAEEYARLQSAVERERLALVISRKSFASNEIAQADEERDRLYRSFRQAVKAFLQMPLPDKSEAAKLVWQRIKDYRLRAEDQMDKETGLLGHLCSDLRGEFAEAVNTLGLMPAVVAMDEANDRLEAHKLMRTQERAAAKVGEAPASRLAASMAYRDLVRKVNALAIVYGEEPYANFIDILNIEITRYKRAMLKPLATTSQEGEAQE